MGQDKIFEKLNIELVRDMKYECQVVYILSRIRKILEIKKQRNSYELLNFYCNWSLHVDLKYENTTRIISKMFDQDIDCSEDIKSIAKRMKSNHADFFKLNDLKNELRKFFEANDLSLNLVSVNKQWIKFIKLLLGIIEDCPVICISSSKKIKKMELVKDTRDNYCYKFELIDLKEKPIIKLKFK